jgi:uncharacterized protein YbaR (Trm112 family)
MSRTFEYREKQHDFGEKTFLGVTGNLGGEDVLRIITENKQCAYFITDSIPILLSTKKEMRSARQN